MSREDESMSIIKQYCKKTDTYYVYDCESYYRPDKKRCYYKRKLIGKIDPSSGAVIPTGKRGRPKKNDTPAKVATETSAAPCNSDKASIDEIMRLNTENASLRSKVKSMEKVLLTIQEALMNAPLSNRKS